MKIMIVEDYAVSRKIMIKKLSHLGECIAVDSGKKAIALFDKAIKNKTPFDLIILDISMPDMDGIMVLSIIRKKENTMNITKDKQIKIIMVTANMRMASIKQCISLGCNSYISKPFKNEKIYEEFERLGFKIPENIKSKGNNQKSYTDLVAKVINRFNNGEIELPVLPHMAKEIQKLLAGPEPSIDELSKIIKNDAVISTKLILAANSALYKGVDTVDTLNDALVRLGIKNTLSMITTISSKNLFASDNDGLKSLLNKLWLHALACACCCKFLAEELEDECLEDVFLMGIIHDIGKVLLLKAIADISPDEPLGKKDLLSAIQDVHTVFGAVLIKKWGFSKKHINATELHHWESYPENTEPELLITHIANRMVGMIGFGSFHDTANNEIEDLESKNIFDLGFLAILEQINIKPGQIKKIYGMVEDTMIDISDKF
ncbi:MAG: HDOD domain-containing protein [Pseudomonadota bacterium]